MTKISKPQKYGHMNGEENKKERKDVTTMKYKLEKGKETTRVSCRQSQKKNTSFQGEDRTVFTGIKKKKKFPIKEPTSLKF